MRRRALPTPRNAAQPANFRKLFAQSLSRRGGVTPFPDVTAYRLFDGAGDGIAGVYLDRYGPAAVLSVHHDSGWDDNMVSAGAEHVLDVLRATGVEAVYVKRHARDRPRLGGRAPQECLTPTPRAGVTQPETLVVEEHGIGFEVRPYDGFSTGLFLEHREHRRALPALGARRVLNLFAYTCAFSVPLAAAGANVTNVDVSARYLAWGRRNHALNGLDAARVRYRRMDAFAYLTYAARHADERFDLVVLDPPTFGTADARRGIKAWKATTDYPALLTAAVRVLAPGGLIFAATNTRDLAVDDALRRMVETTIGRVRWEKLPPWPNDVREHGRVAAVLFRPR